MPFVVHHPVQYRGRDKKGTGHCAALPQALLPGCPHTCHWKQGVQVKMKKDLPPGTVIATFNSNGDYHYVEHEHLAHTALYVGQDAEGITVVHQHKKLKTIELHKYRFGDRTNAVQNADNYYVVEQK